MKRESQGCAVRETLLPPTRIYVRVHVQERLPPTHLPHLKADGTRLPHTHVRVRLVHIVPCDLATIKLQNQVDNEQSENLMKDDLCKGSYTQRAISCNRFFTIPSVTFRDVYILIHLLN